MTGTARPVRGRGSGRAVASGRAAAPFSAAGRSSPSGLIMVIRVCGSVGRGADRDGGSLITYGGDQPKIALIWA
ncbi:hypothetical protein PS9374_02293 [Planomonospora sphaerica]|uniref:Uncharacterized protein n=1 Tax=Planomonospora sphaerica TaxID=161355 RepID=A0A161MAF5_9ACTN|nr:hypothetical protein PS9374_02293 [Planomonospora sphaerica]